MLQKCVTKLSPPFIAKRRNALMHLASTLHKNVNKDEEPVVFTKSKGFRTTPTFINPRYNEERPPLQDISILISLVSFMTYFFCLREENGADELLRGSLYDRIDGLELADLLTSLRHNEQEGLDTTALKARLDEIIAEEEKEKSDYDEKEQQLSQLYKKD